MADFTVDLDTIFSLRDAVGNAMVEIGEANPNMIVAVADVATSSRVNGFAEEYPERFYNLGVAEQNLMSFSAGMAHEGFMPYAFTFAPFASMRACEQVRTDICYNGLSVRILANYAGYSGAESGATHSALEDVAIMASMGNMTVIEPGSPHQIVDVLKATIEWDGPIYIRMGKEATRSLYDPSVKYEIGKALIPRDGKDGAFIASGIVVHHAVEAAQRLWEDFKVEIRVVDMHTIKPLDAEAVANAAATGNVIAAQDHSIIGGLGSHVAAQLAQDGLGINFKILGSPDEYVPVATPAFLYSRNHYDADGLYTEMKQMLKL